MYIYIYIHTHTHTYIHTYIHMHNTSVDGPLARESRYPCRHTNVKNPPYSKYRCRSLPNVLDQRPLDGIMSRENRAL
jgi:hypothetical protein